MPENTLHLSQKIPELLAPAGSMNAFFAAVAAGADAVYLSGKQFGARKFARNFSDEEIAESVGYAHARGVRVYVTTNTLVHDRELPRVARVPRLALRDRGRCRARAGPRGRGTRPGVRARPCPPRLDPAPRSTTRRACGGRTGRAFPG